MRNLGLCPVKESVMYNFTVTLNPKMFEKDPIEQLNNSQSILVNVLRKEIHVVKMTVVAELTQTCNIHYHGIMTVNLNRISGLVVNKFYNVFRKKDIRKTFGMTRCHQTQFDEASKQYLVKDLMLTYSLLHKTCYPIIHDDYKVDDHFTFQQRYAVWIETAREEYILR